MPLSRLRWFVPALLGLGVFSLLAPLAGTSWTRARVLAALESAEASLTSPKDAAIAAELDPADTAAAQRARAVLFTMIAGMALLPVIPFLREWAAARRTPSSSSMAPPEGGPIPQ